MKFLHKLFRLMEQQGAGTPWPAKTFFKAFGAYRPHYQAGFRPGGIFYQKYFSGTGGGAGFYSLFLVSLLLFWLLGSTQLAQAQPSIQWEKTYGGDGHDDLTFLQQTADGGYILGGISESDVGEDKTQGVVGVCDYSPCPADFWVLKLDAAGNKVWDKTLGGTDGDGATAVHQTPDGGYLLGGFSGSGISGDKTEACKGSSDFWLVKIDAAGNKLWDKTIGGNKWDYLRSLQPTADGGYILGGISDSDPGGDKTEASKGKTDYWIVKLDAAGNKVWDKTIGSSGWDELVSVVQTPEGGYLLAGNTASGIGGDKTEASKGDLDFWLVKLDPAGNKLWDKTIGGDDYDKLRAMKLTRDGGFILGGTSASGRNGDKTEPPRGPNLVYDYPLADYWVVKLDAAGNLQWDKTLGGSLSDQLTDLIQTSDGGYLVGGFSESSSGFEKTEDMIPEWAAYPDEDSGDYWVIKLDAAGNREWDKTLGGSDFDYLIALQQTREGGFILGGNSSSYASGHKTEGRRGPCFREVCEADFWLVKLSPEPEGTQVSSFNLINAYNEQVMWQIRDGDEIHLGLYHPTRSLNIRVNTYPTVVGSVRFQLSGAAKRNKWDNTAPYALYGDKDGNYYKWIPEPGTYTLTATPYAQADAKGQAGTPHTIRFTVVYQRSQGLRHFILIDARRNAPIQRLRSGDVIDISNMPSPRFNIETTPLGGIVGSVYFELKGPVSRNEVDDYEPYSVFGDNNYRINRLNSPKYTPWKPVPGEYTLTAWPYPGPGAQGRAGTPLSIRFRIVNRAARMEVAGSPPAFSGPSRLFPNPTPDGRFRLQLGDNLQGLLSYHLLSPLGQKLSSGILQADQPGQVLELDFSRQLPARGIYYLQINQGAEQQVFKILRE